MPKANLLKSGHWRAVYLETCQHGSGRGGWKRTRSRLAVAVEANGRVNELRRKPSTSPAAYSTSVRNVRQRAGVFCAMKQGPIPGVNIAHNTTSRGYRGGELDDDSTPVSRPLNIAHNTLPQVFARMGLLPRIARPKAELIPAIANIGWSTSS